MIFCLFGIDPFLSESRAQNFFDRGHFIEDVYVSPSQIHQEVSEKSLLADKTSMRMFLSTPSKFFTKKAPEKMIRFENYDCPL